MNFQIDFLTMFLQRSLTIDLSPVLQFEYNILASDNAYKCSRHLYCKSITKEIILRKYFLDTDKSLRRFFLKFTNNFKTYQLI